MLTTVGLLVLIFIVIAIWFFFPEARPAPLWKLIYVILAVLTILWLLNITGVWSPGHRLGANRSSGGLTIVRS